MPCKELDNLPQQQWEEYKKKDPEYAYHNLLSAVTCGLRIKEQDGQLVHDFNVVPQEVIAQYYDDNKRAGVECYKQTDRAAWCQHLLNKKDCDWFKKENFSEIVTVTQLFLCSTRAGQPLNDTEKLLFEKFKRVLYEKSFDYLSKTFKSHDRATLLKKCCETGKGLLKGAECVMHAHAVGKPLTDAEKVDGKLIIEMVQNHSVNVVKYQYGNNAQLPYLRDILAQENKKRAEKQKQMFPGICDIVNERK